jgi:hypothetical protein
VSDGWQEFELEYGLARTSERFGLKWAFSTFASKHESNFVDKNVLVRNQDANPAV